MEIIKFEKEELSQALQPVLSVVERRNALPILLNVLINFHQNRVSFTTSDIEIQITSMLLNKNNNLENVELTVSARKFYEIIKSLSETETISLSLLKEKFVVQQAQSKFSLQTLPSKDFPLIKLTDPCLLEFSFKSDKVKGLLDSVAFSMAVQDVRYYLNGLFLQISEKNVIAVTTDGHRLCFNSMSIELSENSMEPVTCILPRKAVIELQRIFNSERNTDVTFRVYSNYMEVVLPTKKIITKLIEGNYPDYQKVIPQESKHHVKFNKKDLLEKLNRVSILTSDKYRGIRILLSGQKVQLKSTNSDQEEAIEEIITEEGTGELDIGFNVTYLIEALNNISSEKIGFSFTNAQSSAVITNSENTEFKYIVMPMRL